jgi:hypothetical protein
MRHLILHEANSLQVLRGCVKLLPLLQPPVRARTDARTNPSAQRAKQYRTKLLLLSHKFSNVMINSTSLNEAHYRSFPTSLIHAGAEALGAGVPHLFTVQGVARLSTLVSHNPGGSMMSLLLRAAMEAAL